MNTDKTNGLRDFFLIRDHPCNPWLKNSCRRHWKQRGIRKGRGVADAANEAKATRGPLQKLPGKPPLRH
jgi:hypothetical protein